MSNLQSNNLLSGSGAFAENRVLAWDGSVLKYPANAATAPAGVLGYAATGGDYVIVINGESARIAASGSISAGGFVMASADGDGKVAALSGSTAYVVGQAQSAASGGEVLVNVNILPPATLPNP
jgi:hypothetical protein